MESPPEGMARASGAPGAGDLARRITGLTAGAVLISNVVGAGIFTTTGFLARDIGDPGIILALWVVGAILSLAGAMSYSELGAAMPHAGGEYVYIREAYGRAAGFLSGWASFTIGFGAAIAASVVGFASYVLPVIGAESDPWRVKVVALIALWFLTGVHVAGVGPGGLLQRALTIVKVGAIATLVIAGLGVGDGDWANLTIVNPASDLNLSTIAVSLIFITFAYSGWNAAGYIAGEIQAPGRNIPRVMTWGTIFVGICYVLLNVVYMYALPVTELSGVLEVAGRAATGLFGPQAARLVTAMLSLSILGAASAMVWAGPRVYYAMARDGVFPAALATTMARTGSPAKAIIAQSIWVTILTVTGTFEQLVVYAGFILALFSAIAVGSVIVLRWRRPQMERPYRVRPYPLVPLLYIGTSAAIMWYTLFDRPVESLLGVATVLLGLPLYWYFETPKRGHPNDGRGTSSRSPGSSR